MAKQHPVGLGFGMTSARTRARMVAELHTRGVSDTRVLEAMNQVPRHLFVDEALATRAYEETALPIGWGQTISQPWEVARMTEAALDSNPRQVLEVGAGSGYQSAILGELVESVWAVELLDQLALRARTILARLGYPNISIRSGDGCTAWRNQGPFDAILVAACFEQLPQALLQQIAPEGCLVAPLGSQETQRLTRWVRGESGFQCTDFGPCRFVPLYQDNGD